MATRAVVDGSGLTDVKNAFNAAIASIQGAIDNANAAAENAEYLGVHVQANTYKKNNSVTDANDDLYIALQDVPGNTPISNGTYWQKAIDFSTPLTAMEDAVDAAVDLITNPDTGAIKQVDDKIVEADAAILNAENATTLANAAAATYELIQFMPGTRFIDGVEAIFALTDETGYVCMYFDAEGRGYFPAGIQNLPNAFSEVDMTGITLDAVWGVRDQDGRVAIYIDSQGDYHIKTLYASNIISDGISGFAPVSTSDIYCLGDSLTEGSGGTPYTTFLQSLYPLRSIINGGFAAQNAQQIAARFGASGITLTVSGNQIPASGSVNVTITSGNDPLQHAALSRSMTGTIAGVYGVLTKTFSGGQYSFARQTPGDAVNTSASGEFFFVDNERPRKATCIFWIGRNNVTTGSSQVPVVERAVKQVVSHMRSIQKNFVVLSVLNASDEPTGSANHTTTLAINAALNLAFPYNYLDIRSILATEPDGTIPAALRSDTIHLNSTGYELVANEIRKFLTLKGF